MHLIMCLQKPSHDTCITACIEQIPPITARTQNESQHVLNKAITCQVEHKKHLNKFWFDLSHATENTKCISSFVYQTHLMPLRTKNVSEHVLKKSIPCQRGHKICLNLCGPNLSLAWEDTEYISTCVDQTNLTTARTQNVSQVVLTKHHSCQPGPKMHLNLCWPDASHASEDPKCISTCVDQTPPMTARTQNASQHVLTKRLPCQRGNKTYLNMCWPNLSNDSEDTKYISSCVDQTPLMPARSQNVSQHLLTKILPC